MPRSRLPISSSRKRSSAELHRRADCAWRAWQRIVARIANGERPQYRFARLGPTPPCLQEIGLGPADLVMTVGKMVRAMTDHPQVPLTIWANLPTLIDKAAAGFPSAKEDGSIVVVILARDDANDPIVVPIQWDAGQGRNVLLSVYGRSGTDRVSGDEWVRQQLNFAVAGGKPNFKRKGLTDAEPNPEPASQKNATSWSPGFIPEDRPVRPRKQILSIGSKIKNDIEENDGS